MSVQDRRSFISSRQPNARPHIKHYAHMHPSEVLFQGTCPPVSIPACDHYAGSEKLMRKSLALQHELGPVFDITFDCEDGAAHGNEEAHAHMLGALIASEDNRFGHIGARVHDIASAFFEPDIERILQHAAAKNSVSGCAESRQRC